MLLLRGRCIKLTRADFEAGSAGGSEAVSDLWAWLQHNESVTIGAKQSGLLCFLLLLPQSHFQFSSGVLHCRDVW